MWPFNTRRCRCSHPRHTHVPEWSWSGCAAIRCSCSQFRWVRAHLYWDWRYRRAQRPERRRAA